MDTKSRLLVYGLILVLVISAYRGYQVFFVERNFIVDGTTTCAPETESCFVWCEDDDCEEDYYKKISKSAGNIPVCNAAVEECASLSCEPGEENCEIIFCSSEFVEEGERCTNPSDFIIEESAAVSTSSEESLL